MNHDADGSGELAGERPLEPGIKAAIDSVDPAGPGASFWSDLDGRLDDVDNERGIRAAEAEIEMAPTVLESRPEIDGNGRVRFLAAAALIAVAAVGLVWLLAQSGATSTDPAGTDLPEPSVLSAEDMATKVEGESEPGAWLIWRAGYIEDQVTFPADGTYEFVVVAKGRFSGGGELGPDLELLVDSITVEATQPVQLDAFAEYRFVGEVKAGTHAVGVSNARLSTPTVPSNDQGESPLLIVDRISISPVSE